MTATGDPVRSLLSYTGVADRLQVKLDVVVEFQDVMARILIRSPRRRPGSAPPQIRPLDG